MGLLAGDLAFRGDAAQAWRLFLTTGILGGFTTYSAFAVQLVELGGTAPVVSLALAGVSVFGGVIAAALGLQLGHLMAGVAADRVEIPEAAE